MPSAKPATISARFMLLSTGWNDSRSLDHQNYGSLRRASPVPHTSGNRECLPRVQLNRPVLQVDQELSLDHVEEFIFLFVLMPMELALDNAQTDHAITHPAQRLVIPTLLACVRERLDVNQFERTEAGIEVDGIGRLIGHEDLPWVL